MIFESWLLGCWVTWRLDRYETGLSYVRDGVIRTIFALLARFRRNELAARGSGAANKPFFLTGPESNHACLKTSPRYSPAAFLFRPVGLRLDRLRMTAGLTDELDIEPKFQSLPATIGGDHGPACNSGRSQTRSLAK